MTKQRIRTLTLGEQTSFADDVRAGLSGQPKRIRSVHFYDERGSELFAQIMRTDEYYLTDAETEIFETRGQAIAARVPEGPLSVVDLGAGDGTKTELLLRKLAGDGLGYMPVDVSREAIEGLLERLATDLPDLECEGLHGSYDAALEFVKASDGPRRLALFLGSNIGNFAPIEAHLFMNQLREALRPDDLALVGFDLKKDLGVLQRAYMDGAGVTTEFNLNLLARMNRELGANFDLSRFAHHAFYNPVSGAMESYLISRVRQTVRIEALDTSFEFAPFEPIHTEYSHKYTDEDIALYAERSGFEIVELFNDSRGLFADALLRAV